MDADTELLLDDDGVEEGKKLEEEESYQHHQANRQSRILDLEESAGGKRNRMQHILGKDKDLIVAVFVVAFDTKKG